LIVQLVAEPFVAMQLKPEYVVPAEFVYALTMYPVTPLVLVIDQLTVAVSSITLVEIKASVGAAGTESVESDVAAVPTGLLPTAFVA
jgi:hypothetical protein